MSTKPHEYAQSDLTGEVFASTPSEVWFEALEAWQAAMRECGHDVKKCLVASPMPVGHVMFLRSDKRRPSIYKPRTARQVTQILEARRGST